jgi:hypothetical protein
VPNAAYSSLEVDRMKKTIKVQGHEVSFTRINDEDYISLTDMAKDFGGNDQIKNWIRTRNTIEFLGTWESINNPDFNMVGFHHVRMEMISERFIISPTQWVERTNSKGILAKSGRYGGGTIAHADIAFEFGSWLSPQFKLYLYTEFQRLKKIESNSYNLEWNVKRVLTKAHYKLHTDAIRDYIIPAMNISKDKEWIVYANEADLLNVAVFGFTAKQWKEANPSLALANANPRDYASINELAVISSLESIHSMLIQQGIDKQNRFDLLRKMATEQLENLKKLDLMKSVKRQNDTTYLTGDEEKA